MSARATHVVRSDGPGQMAAESKAPPLPRETEVPPVAEVVRVVSADQIEIAIAVDVAQGHADSEFRRSSPSRGSFEDTPPAKEERGSLLFVSAHEVGVAVAVDIA